MPRTLLPITQLPPPPTTLTDLPDDLIRPNNSSESSIGNYLNVQALCRLSCVCKSLRDALKEDIKKIKLITLLTHIVNADLANAEIIIKTDPSLLLEEGQVTQKIDDQTSYCYKGTALSIALELGDISIHKENEEMADMIICHLKTLPNGKAEIKKQIQAHFPHGFVFEQPYNFTEIFNAIQTSSDADVQTALNKEQNDTPLCKALNKFREEFSKCSRNFCHFVAAVALYDTEFDSFKNWDQRELFCRQVMGFVQRDLPFCDIYTIKQGIYNVVEGKQHLTRDGFEFKNWATPGSNGTQKIQVFPCFVNLGLGFDFLVVGVGRGGVVARWRRGGRVRGAVCVLEELMSNKNRTLVELYTSVCAAAANSPGTSGKLPASLAR